MSDHSQEPLPPSSPPSFPTSDYADELPISHPVEEPPPPSLSYEGHLEDVKQAVHEAFQSDNRESKWYTPWLESFYYRCKVLSTPKQRATLGSQIELAFLGQIPQHEYLGAQYQLDEGDEQDEQELPTGLVGGLPDDYDEPEISFDSNVTVASDDENNFRDLVRYRIPDFVGFLARVIVSEGNPQIEERIYHPFFLAELKAAVSGIVIGSDCGASSREQASSIIDQSVKQARIQARHAFSEFSRGANRITFLPAFVISGIFFRLVLFRRKDIMDPNSDDELRAETGFLSDVSCLFEYDADEREPVRFSEAYLRAWEKIAIAWRLKE